MKLERDKLEPDRYKYLSKDMSEVYDRALEVKDLKDLVIQALIEYIVVQAKGAHTRSDK